MSHYEDFPQGVAEFHDPHSEFLNHLLNMQAETPLQFETLLSVRWQNLSQAERTIGDQNMPEVFRHSSETVSLYWRDYIIGLLADEFVARDETATRGVDGGGEVGQPGA